MKGCAWGEFFTTYQRETFEKATALVASLPEFPGLRCHELTRAVCKRLFKGDEARKVEVVDGICLGAEHSWIELPAYAILDVYSVSRYPMVQLIDVGRPTLMRRVYERGARRTDINEAHIEVLILWWAHRE